MRYMFSSKAIQCRVITDGDAFESSLNLLKSFKIPVIATKETSATLKGKSSSLYSVSPSLKYISQGLVKLLKDIHWSTATMVISNDIPIHFSRLFEEMAKTVNLAVTLDPTTSSELPVTQKAKRESNAENIEKTIFVLNADEALRFLRNLESPFPLENDDTVNWILVSTEDISQHLRASYSPDRVCHMKPMFIFVPQDENTEEFQRFFTQEITVNGVNSKHPLIAEFTKAYFNKIFAEIPFESVSGMIKAVWTLAASVRSLERKECNQYSKSQCLKRIRMTLLSSMNMQIEHLNTIMRQTGVNSLEQFRMIFDEENILKSNKYILFLRGSNCKLVELGFYHQDRGLIWDHQLLRKMRYTLFNIDAKNSAFNENDVKDKIEKILRTDNNNNVTKHTIENDTLALNSFKSTSFSDNRTRDILRREQFTPIADTNNVYSKSNTRLLERKNKNTTNADIVKRKHISFTSWLGRSWALTILTVSVIGSLLTLYVFTFLLMKSCEGSLKKSNQDLLTTHLIAIISVFFGASLYVFHPTSFMCSIRTSVHNVSLALLFGSLLQKAMQLQSQKWIGLGGKVSKLNQCLTLMFIVGIQLALELQRWRYETPTSDDDYSQELPNLCTLKANDYLYSQAYIMILLSLLVVISWCARSQPFSYKDGSYLFFTAIIIVPIYALSTILKQRSTDFVTGDDEDTERTERLAMFRDVITSLSMITVSIMSLLGIFGPLLYSIHKYGVLPRKNGSYAESLSTAFTLFKGTGPESRPGDAYSSHYESASNSVSNEQQNVGRNKPPKKLDNSSLFDYVVCNRQTTSCPRVVHRVPRDQEYYLNYQTNNREDIRMHSHSAELCRNPLYDDSGFRSAYP
ncbi:uncharacterized protein B4U80_10135 [Leptotrombidium deliense]|uniref:G-protein coupled receptors family 3 profile domain-containing protein n=1 Tax=Leptotrombidium deliense TaxID=299467 RepID=A0A443SLV2_9ACAR|nr:uncharacterized protein B4U80_10135 [Leptotrombidium deliense]